MRFRGAIGSAALLGALLFAQIRAPSIARRLLARYHWGTVSDGPIRVHTVPATPAARESAQLLRAAASALQRDTALLGTTWPGGAIDVFVFSSRDAMQRAIGRVTNGMVEPGEDSVFLFYDGTRPPVLVHELMHVVINRMWGVAPRSRDWLSEGVATWAVGECAGQRFIQLAATLDREKRLPRLAALTTDFRRLDELSGFVAAASVVEVIIDRHGIAGLRAMWTCDGNEQTCIGRHLPALEKEWTAALRAQRPAPFPRSTIEASGCEPPLDSSQR